MLSLSVSPPLEVTLGEDDDGDDGDREGEGPSLREASWLWL